MVELDKYLSKENEVELTNVIEVEVSETAFKEFLVVLLMLIL